MQRVCLFLVEKSFPCHDPQAERENNFLLFSSLPVQPEFPAAQQQFPFLILRRRASE